MLVLLPPSETKRDGGVEGSSLDLRALSHPELGAARKAALSALSALSRNRSTAAAALGLGPSQLIEVDRNRAVRTSATMPAIDRYTGVLYDALDAATLHPGTNAREWLESHVVVHSALFGLVRAGDPIPAYRLSHNSRLPGLSLRTHWRTRVAELLDRESGLILDLRSESYAGLGPAPKREGSRYVRVVSEGPSGQRKALTHFNKRGKGEFVRALALAGVDHADEDSLLEWAATNGVRLEPGAPGELDLYV